MFRSQQEEREDEAHEEDLEEGVEIPFTDLPVEEPPNEETPA